jgi:hypothetical protein
MHPGRTLALKPVLGSAAVRYIHTTYLGPELINNHAPRLTLTRSLFHAARLLDIYVPTLRSGAKNLLIGSCTQAAPSF